MTNSSKVAGPEANRLDLAIKTLIERGPMKAKKLAGVLKLPNARSLSMQLQWSHASVRYKGGKWEAVSKS